ncbi:type II toxin-antitoxin system Phd/YefM family antitoxin [Catenuloplanes sp. NPDC051500]|uniref:type II toxin-antitoxin system Phd/YefM family antitoxin n=1 Tax=Catenuloplanes sp. NPDC051500 TaxID=3363959 RepID=UPI0037A9796D
MRIFNYTEARANLAEVLNSIEKDADAVTITRAGHDPVVVISQRLYESFIETEHVLGNRHQARELFDRIDDIEAGRTVQHSLEEMYDITEEPAHPSGAAA